MSPEILRRFSEQNKLDISKPTHARSSSDTGQSPEAIGRGPGIETLEGVRSFSDLKTGPKWETFQEAVWSFSAGLCLGTWITEEHLALQNPLSSLGVPKRGECGMARRQGKAASFVQTQLSGVSVKKLHMHIYIYIYG